MWFALLRLSGTKPLSEIRLYLCGAIPIKRSPSVRLIFNFDFDDPSAPSTWPPPSQTSPNRFSMEEGESLAAFLLGILDQPWCHHCSCRKLLLQSSGLLACDWAEDPGWEENAQPSQPSACPILSPEAKLWSYFSSLAKYPSFLRIKRHHKLASAQHIPWAQLYVFI